jgi:hypothetical protein
MDIISPRGTVVAQLLNKFLILYETGNIMAMFTKTRHCWLFVLSRMNPDNSHILKIIFNIILPSAPKSPKWSRPFKYFDQNFVLFYFYFACYMFYSPPILYLSTSILTAKE